MRRGQISRAMVNRRCARRRWIAIPALRPAVRPLLAGLKLNFRTAISRLQSAITSLCWQFGERAGDRYSRLRQAAAVRRARIRAGAAAWGELFLTGFFSIRRALSASRRYLLARLARIWVAANREVEFPQINLSPYLRVASALFAIAAIAVAGFTTWHVTRGDPNADKPAFVASRDHHPPLGRPVTRQPAPRAVVLALDAEADFVTLAGEPEDGSAEPESRYVASALDIDVPDIDAGGWYNGSAIAGPEEELVAALSPTPRAAERPNIPRAPLATGIPMRPEGPDGVMPPQPLWLANAVEPPRRGMGPMIAIVIDDAGVAQERTARAIELAPPLTFAFIPYGQNLAHQTGEARRRGHELLLHIPMEPGNTAIDPGHNALLTSLSGDEIMRRFRWALDRFDGYVGVNNHMGSKFMARGDLVQRVLEEINARGLLFLDSRTDHRTAGTRLARDMGMPHATRNVFLDNDLDAANIRAQLAELERVARRRGHAIAIGHPHDVTVEVLAEWIPEARRKGFVLVPVSTIVKQEYGPRLASAAAGGETDGLLGGAQ